MIDLEVAVDEHIPERDDLRNVPQFRAHRWINRRESPRRLANRDQQPLHGQPTNLVLEIPRLVQAFQHRLDTGARVTDVPDVRARLTPRHRGAPSSALLTSEPRGCARSAVRSDQPAV